MGSEKFSADGGFGSMAYRSYALTALLIIYIFNSVDRVLLAILQENIKKDMVLSDFQLGLLGGPAFVILYTCSQIPIARLAERKNRITIISVGAAAWSFATAACGLAQNFTQLLFARIGVGIGEAACIPPSHSAISDYFPKSQRATALAVFGLAIPIGGIIAAQLAAAGLDMKACQLNPGLAECIALGGEGLRKSLLFALIFMALAVISFWLASRTMEADALKEGEGHSPN